MNVSSYREILNTPSAWWPAMRRPDGWGDLLLGYWQEQIDGIIGTTNGRPRLQLRWGPEVMRWRPALVGEGAYDFPDWTCGFTHGQPVAVPRWVLMERCEPEQYANGWESHRRLFFDNRWHDIRGPMPQERYTKCFMHAVHEDGCCLQARVAEGNACYGCYVEPNDELLDWVRERWALTLADSDVQPFSDARTFRAPNAQLEGLHRIATAREAQTRLADEVFEDVLSHAARQPRSTGVN